MQAQAPIPKENHDYHQAYQFYCGVDLHARTMYLCVFNHASQKLLHREVPSDAAALQRWRPTVPAWSSLANACSSGSGLLVATGIIDNAPAFGEELCPQR
jgi:hypothetical protein